MKKLTSLFFGILVLGAFVKADITIENGFVKCMVHSGDHMYICSVGKLYYYIRDHKKAGLAFTGEYCKCMPTAEGFFGDSSSKIKVLRK